MNFSSICSIFAQVSIGLVSIWGHLGTDGSGDFGKIIPHKKMSDNFCIKLSPYGLAHFNSAQSFVANFADTQFQIAYIGRYFLYLKDSLLCF